MSARLICRSGELAGSRFELGSDTMIGRDAAKRIVVGAAGGDVAARLARIVERDGGTFLEALQPGSVTLDGMAVTVPARLDRMHVIGVEGVDFVFSRAPAAAPSAEAKPSPAPPSPAPPPPPRQPPPAEAEASPSEAPKQPELPGQPDAGHTVVDMVGFGALPELRAETTKPAQPPTDAGRTVVDMAGFGALPDLPKAPRRGTAGPSAERDANASRQPDSAAEPAAGDPGVAPAPPEPAPAPPPTAPEPPAAPPPAAPAIDPPADADATVQMPAFLFELDVNVPGHGPATFMLKIGDNIIGRGSDCDIPIVDPEMWLSRKHANVRVSVDQIELIDLQGRNGTYIRGERIDRALITPGSTFVLGPHLEFKLQQR